MINSVNSTDLAFSLHFFQPVFCFTCLLVCLFVLSSKQIFLGTIYYFFCNFSLLNASSSWVNGVRHRCYQESYIFLRNNQPKRKMRVMSTKENKRQRDDRECEISESHEKRINKNYAMFWCSRNYNNLKFASNPPALSIYIWIFLISVNVWCDHITSNRFTDKSDACVFEFVHTRAYLHVLLCAIWV